MKDFEIKYRPDGKLKYVLVSTEFPEELSEKLSKNASRLVRDEEGNIIKYTHYNSIKNIWE